MGVSSKITPPPGNARYAKSYKGRMTHALDGGGKVYVCMELRHI